MLSAPIGVSDDRRRRLSTLTRPTRGRRVRRSREEWHALLERFERSGQRREEFCREQGLTRSSFDRWRRALGRTGSGRGAVSDSALFVELMAQESASVAGWDVELALGDGMVLRLRRPC